MKHLSLIAILLITHIQLNGQTLRTSWPMIGGDPERTSMARINLEFPVQIKKVITLGHDKESGMIVTPGQLFVGDYGDPNQIIATDLETGNFQWSFDIPNTGGGMDHVPAVHDTIVVAGGQGGKGLYACHVASGDSLWFQPVKSLYTRSPLITEEKVYIAAQDGLFCFELSTGNPVWSYNTSTPQISPAADSQGLYFCSRDTLFAMNKNTGDVLWKNDLVPVGNYTSLSVDDEILFVGYDTMIAGVNKFTGEILWQTETPTGSILNDFPSAFALHDDVLLVKLLIASSEDDNLYLILDRTTGLSMNSYPAAKQYAAPTIINQYVVEYLDGTLRFLDLMTGALAYELTSLPITSHQTQIIAANDEIYIGGNGPDVMVLKGSTTSVPVLKTIADFRVVNDPGTNEFEIHIMLDRYSDINITLINTEGRLMATENLGSWDAGFHRIPFHLNAPGGVYVLAVSADSKQMTQKIWIAE